MPPVAAAVIALVGLVLVFSAVWAWQLKSENAGMIDPVWVYSLGTVAVLYAVLGTRGPDLGGAPGYASVAA
jgi:steroid 5-alpha reductase family enzyme